MADLEEFQDESEEEMEAMTPAEVLEKMEEAWLNEKFAPDLLEAKTELVECILEQIKEMEENIKRAKKGDFKVSIHKLEIDRIRFILSSYLRRRLEKIEQFTIHILETEKERSSEENPLMSPAEFRFANDCTYSTLSPWPTYYGTRTSMLFITMLTLHVGHGSKVAQQQLNCTYSTLSPWPTYYGTRTSMLFITMLTLHVGHGSKVAQQQLKYAQNVDSHFKKIVLCHLPGNLQTLDPKETAPQPNLDSYVFLKVNEKRGGVLVEEETLEAGEEIVDLEASDQHLMRYRPISVLVTSGAVSLL